MTVNSSKADEPSLYYSTHGYQESVLRSHRSRTAHNSAAFLLPSLRPNMHLLDVGCGPGTITVDFASFVPQGRVTGLDISPEVLESAKAVAKEREISNCDFVVGSALSIPFPDNTFDVIYVHQVLQHLNDPVSALREIRRVAKPGGIVACRETDVGAMTWYPYSEGLEEWRNSYRLLAKILGVESNAGRQAHVWVKKAGFQRSDITLSTSATSYTTAQEVAWWGELWQERTLSSSFAETAKNHACMSDEDLKRIGRAWYDWSRDDDAWFAMLQSEMVCVVQK